MTKKAYDKIARGLEEVLAVARGEKKPARLVVPGEIDVKAIRTKVDQSQDDFSAAFGFTVNQIKDWEQGRSRPIGGVRAYLMMIEADPARVLSMLQAISARKAA